MTDLDYEKLLDELINLSHRYEYAFDLMRAFPRRKIFSVPSWDEDAIWIYCFDRDFNVTSKIEIMGDN